MRFGAPIFAHTQDPVALAKAHRALNYRAAYCPDHLSMNDLSAVHKAARAFEDEDVVIAEVGAWSNPLDRNEAAAKAAREKIKERLALADELGAKCCVNILGSWSKNGRWDGVDKSQYGQDFFDASVETYREILVSVKPKRTFMTFELMPYYFLDGPQAYLKLLAYIDHPMAAVHLDVCNCVNSPQRLYNTPALIQQCFELLAPKIKSCHLKDIDLDDSAGCTARFTEVPPGSGQMDIAALLLQASKLKDLPVMLEHLPGEQDYLAAREHVLGLIQQNAIPCLL